VCLAQGQHILLQVFNQGGGGNGWLCMIGQKFNNLPPLEQEHAFIRNYSRCNVIGIYLVWFQVNRKRLPMAALVGLMFMVGHWYFEWASFKNI